MHGTEAGAGRKGAHRARQISRDELIEWVLSAQAGARLPYGHGEHASHVASEAVNEELRKLAAQGYIHLFQGKAEPPRNTRDYIAQRSSRQVKP